MFHRDFSGMSEIVPFSHYDVLQCETCGMMFAGNIVESMPLLQYYELMSKYETSAFAKAQELNEVKIGSIQFLLDEISPTDSVIDIGCGEGSLLRSLKKNGFQKLIGLEPSRKNCQTVQEHWGIRAIQGGLGENISELAGETFDVVILDSVFEHLLSVQTNLKQALQYLAEDGKLCLFVPDVGVFPEENDLYQQFSVEHINCFSIQSLKNLMSFFGMRCIKHGNVGEALYTLWQRDTSVTMDSSPVLQFDTEGVRCMHLYLDRAKALSEDLCRKLAPYRGRKVYLWAAGTHTATLYQLGLLDDIYVTAIVDSNVNYQGKTIYDVPVIAPQELAARDPLPIIISSQLAQDAIHTQITERMGLTNEVVRLY
jgi:methionine biosynthesis protein metW